MSALEDRLRAWAVPILVTAILGLGSFVFGEQQSRISSLEVQSSASTNALATITANQSNSLADRQQFQSDTTSKIDKMSDVLSAMGQSLAALTAIQQRQEQQKSGS